MHSIIKITPQGEDIMMSSLVFIMKLYNALHLLCYMMYCEQSKFVTNGKRKNKGYISREHPLNWHISLTYAIAPCIQLISVGRPLFLSSLEQGSFGILGFMKRLAAVK